MKTWKEYLIEADIKFNQLTNRNKERIYSYFKPLLRKYTKEQQVEFALFAAKSVFHLITNNEQKQLAKTCIDLVEAWLFNHKSVTGSQLTIAANAASSSAVFSYTGEIPPNVMAIYAAVDTAYAAESNILPTGRVAGTAENAIDADPSVEPRLIQYLHSIDTGHNNYFDKQNNEDQLKGFLQDLSSNEPIQEKHDTIQIFLDFLEDYGISNIRNLGYFSVDPNDPNSIFNNQLVLNNFLRMIQNRIK